MTFKKNLCPFLVGNSLTVSQSSTLNIMDKVKYCIRIKSKFHIEYNK